MGRREEVSGGDTEVTCCPRDSGLPGTMTCWPSHSPSRRQAWCAFCYAVSLSTTILQGATGARGPLHFQQSGGWRRSRSAERVRYGFATQSPGQAEKAGHKRERVSRLFWTNQSRNSGQSGTGIGCDLDVRVRIACRQLSWTTLAVPDTVACVPSLRSAFITSPYMELPRYPYCEESGRPGPGSI